MREAGELFIVATPIGNLEDLSKRAIAVLNSVQKIAAEDTRHSKKLLQSAGITTPLTSYHDFSSDQASSRIIEQLLSGDSIALISDAGTPLISDPGYQLVKHARMRGIKIVPIPGASAITAALSVAGLPTDRFVFEGFLPSKASARLKRLQHLRFEARTLVIYESPHRILQSVEDMQQVFGDYRKMFIARELTKKFETVFLGSSRECYQWLRDDDNQQKGEFVVIIAGCEESELEALKQQQALDIVGILQKSVKMKQAVSIASEITGARKNKLYEAALKSSSAGITAPFKA